MKFFLLATPKRNTMSTITYSKSHFRKSIDQKGERRRKKKRKKILNSYVWPLRMSKGGNMAPVVIPGETNVFLPHRLRVQGSVPKTRTNGQITILCLICNYPTLTTRLGPTSSFSGNSDYKSRAKLLP